MKTIRLIQGLSLVLFLSACGVPWSPEESKDKDTASYEKPLNQAYNREFLTPPPRVKEPNTKDRLIHKDSQDRAHRNDDLQSYVRYK